MVSWVEIETFLFLESAYMSLLYIEASEREKRAGSRKRRMGGPGEVFIR